MARDRSDDPHARIADLERALRHQRELTEHERRARRAAEEKADAA
jgi:hypothetical protein